MAFNEIGTHRLSASSSLYVAIAVDDVRPERGFGLPEDQPMRLLSELRSKLGCRYTLFVPTNWHGRFPIESNSEWTRWLLGQGEFEIAAHGDRHLAKNPSRHGSQEFLELSPEEAECRCIRILSAWERFDYKPLGFRWPGWGASEELYPVIARHFGYVADHPEINLLSGATSIPRLQYTHSIETLAYDSEEVLILHSHIAGPGHTNNWTPELAQSLFTFLSKLSQMRKIEYVHLRELASNWDDKRRGAFPLPHFTTKPSDNKTASEFDRDARQPTSTHIDRYAIASHWARGERVLDAACGYGYGSVILHALGARSVVGVDRDPEAIAYAREHYESRNLAFKLSDILSLPFPDGTFDHAVSIETFEHVARDDASRLLRELKRVVRPGGCVIVTTPRRKTPSWDYPQSSPIYEYSPDEFSDALRTVFGTVQIIGIQVHQLPSQYQFASDLVEDVSQAEVLLAIAQAS